jgi:hypothetical protein
MSARKPDPRQGKLHLFLEAAPVPSGRQKSGSRKRRRRPEPRLVASGPQKPKLRTRPPNPLAPSPPYSPARPQNRAGVFYIHKDVQKYLLVRC